MFHDLIVQMDALMYPLVGLASFALAFGVVLVRALRQTPEELDARARIPLEGP